MCVCVACVCVLRVCAVFVLIQVKVEGCLQDIE